MNLFLSSKADRQLNKLPSPIYQLVLSQIKALASVPFPVRVKKLISRNGWRLRIGDYRIIYIVDKRSKTITILSVSHRKDAYRIS